MSHKIAKDLLCYIKEQQHPFHIEKKQPPIAQKAPPAEKKQPTSELHSWASSQFALADPITPIICLDVHPFLQKISDALTKFVATTSLLSLDKIEKMSWDALFANPLFQILLVPIDHIEQIPFLKQRVPIPEPHKLTTSIFPLEKIELYLHDATKKRDLWENLKRMPLSS